MRTRPHTSVAESTIADSLLEQRIQCREGLGARVFFFGGAFALLEHDKLAGVHALLVPGRLGLRLAAAVAHRRVVGVALEAAMQWRASMRAILPRPRGPADAGVRL